MVPVLREQFITCVFNFKFNWESNFLQSLFATVKENVQNLFEMTEASGTVPSSTLKVLNMVLFLDLVNFFYCFPELIWIVCIFSKFCFIKGFFCSLDFVIYKVHSAR